MVVVAAAMVVAVGPSNFGIALHFERSKQKWRSGHCLRYCGTTTPSWLQCHNLDQLEQLIFCRHSEISRGDRGYFCLQHCQSHIIVINDKAGEDRRRHCVAEV